MAFISAYNLIDSVVVFLLLLLSLFLARLDNGDRRSHRLLATFLACLALSYMDGVFISFNYYFHYTYAHMVYATMSFDFLAGPLLYLYVRTRTEPRFRLNFKHLLLALPFLLHFAFIFINYHAKSLAEKRALLSTHQVFSHGEVYALTVISNAHYAIYLALVLYTLRRYQASIRNHYSNLDKVNLKWLLLICCGLLLGGAMRFMNNLLWLEVPQSAFHRYVDLKLVAIGSVLVFAATVLYRCLQQPEIVLLGGAEPAATGIMPPDDSTAHREPVKYKNTALSVEARKALSERLQEFMQSHKPFLDPELTLTELARRLSISSHHLSQVINGEFGQNFYDYINDYRIRESAQRLGKPGYQDIYITRIMSDCGFNSKSVFNTAFKKTFGTTPSNYRKQLQGKTDKLNTLAESS